MYSDVHAQSSFEILFIYYVKLKNNENVEEPDPSYTALENEK